MKKLVDSMAERSVLDLVLAVQKETAKRCAEICYNEEVLLPISVWQDTRKALSAATAVAIGDLISKEFDV